MERTLRLEGRWSNGGGGRASRRSESDEPSASLGPTDARTRADDRARVRPAPRKLLPVYNRADDPSPAIGAYHAGRARVAMGHPDGQHQHCGQGENAWSGVSAPRLAVVPPRRLDGSWGVRWLRSSGRLLRRQSGLCDGADLVDVHTSNLGTARRWPQRLGRVLRLLLGREHGNSDTLAPCRGVTDPKGPGRARAEAGRRADSCIRPPRAACRWSQARPFARPPLDRRPARQR